MPESDFPRLEARHVDQGLCFQKLPKDSREGTWPQEREKGIPGMPHPSTDLKEEEKQGKENRAGLAPHVHKSLEKLV